jgi:N-methylhydantoinase A
LDLSIDATALGIVRVANAAMARALRRVTVERGIDGRDCTLLAFGGGGPMHAAGLAELYGLAEIIVPAASSAFSALGCLTADFSFLQQRTVRLPLTAFDRISFDTRLADLVAEATDPLIANHIAPDSIAIEYVALMRYAAQSEAIPVPFIVPLDPVVLQADFHARHRQLYGYATTEPSIIESLRVQARKPSTTGFARPNIGRQSRAQRVRNCVFAGTGSTPTSILPRETLSSDIAGPAIIEDAWSTVIVPPGWQARADALGNLFMTRSAL